MKKILTLGIAVGLMLAATAVYAAPTLDGATGNGILPTAAVAPASSIQVAADYVNTDPDVTYPIRVLFGATEKLELGAGYSVNDAVNVWNVNAKYALTKLGGFDVAVGARYAAADDAADKTTTDAYVVGTMPVAASETMPLNITLGAKWTQIQNGVDVDGIRGFVGVDTMLVDKLALSAEYQLENDDLGADGDAVWAITARYPLTEMIGAQLGLLDDGSDSNIFAGININFSTSAE